MLENIIGKYEESTSTYYAAARLWVDAIIDPLDTRKWISMGIEAANHAPIPNDFKLGVISNIADHRMLRPLLNPDIQTWQITYESNL